MIFHRSRWTWALALAVCQPGALAAQGLDSPVAGEVETVSGPIRSGEFSRQNGQPLTADEVRFIVNESLAEQEKKKAEADKNQPHVVGSDNKLSASYNNGFWLESAKKDFRMRIGGRTQVDTVWLDGDTSFESGFGPVGSGSNYALQDSVNIRRARLSIEGTVHQTMEWAVEYDFVNSINDNPGVAGQGAGPLNVVNVPAPTDLWWQFSHVPVFGAVRIGNQKEPLGLEHLMSSRYLDFMERSFQQDAYTGPFNNGFTPGISMSNHGAEERMTWQAGVYKNTQNVFAYSVIDAGYAFTARATFLPYWDEPSEGRYFMHLGASASHRQLGQIANGPTENQIRIRSRASLRNGPGPFNPVLADTGIFFGDDQDILGLEFVFQNGPLLLQSEYMASSVSNARLQSGVPSNNVPTAPGASIGSYFSHGYYFEMLYFLTGEHKPYNRRTGTMGRTAVVPYENAWAVRTDCGPLFGRGAWQMGLRYDQLDLRDTIDGGVVQDVTYGVNWFINPRLKLQGNYVWTHRDAPGFAADGDSNGWGMRMAHDF